MNFAGRRGRVLALCFLGLILGFSAFFALYLMHKTEQIDSVFSDVNARYARLLGLQQAKVAIDAGLVQATAELEKTAHVRELAGDRIGTDIQQRIRRLAEASSVDVVGSQTLPVRALPGFEQIAVSFTLEATLEGVRNILVAVGHEVPYVQIDSASLSTTNRRRDGVDPVLNVQLTVSVLRRIQ